MGGQRTRPRLGAHFSWRNLSCLLRAPEVCYAGNAMVERERLLLPDAELSRPVLVLAQRFVQRWDLYAHQIDDGSYVCIHEPLNVSHLFAHLRGEITLGAYLLDQDSRARFLVLDADDAQAWERLGHLARNLAEEDVPVYLERSRRGGHLWLFLTQAVTGREVRAFGHGLLAAHEIEGVELFPKQDELAGGTVLEEDGVPRAPAAGVDLIQQLLPVPLFHELPPPV
jgi:hypothetical protein